MGTCSGFGYAVLEFGQWLLNLDTVHHPHEGIDLQPGENFLQQLNICHVGMHTIDFTPVPDSLTAEVYDGAERVHEESHCVYGVSSDMIDLFDEKGLIVSGYDDERL